MLVALGWYVLSDRPYDTLCFISVLCCFVSPTLIVLYSRRSLYLVLTTYAAEFNRLPPARSDRLGRTNLNNSLEMDSRGNFACSPHGPFELRPPLLASLPVFSTPRNLYADLFNQHTSYMSPTHRLPSASPISSSLRQIKRGISPSSPLGIRYIRFSTGTKASRLTASGEPSPNASSNLPWA